MVVDFKGKDCLGRGIKEISRMMQYFNRSLYNTGIYICKTWMLHSMSKCYTQWELEHFTASKFHLKKKKVAHYWALVNDTHDEVLKHEVRNGLKFKIDLWIVMYRWIDVW